MKEPVFTRSPHPTHGAFTAVHQDAEVPGGDRAPWVRAHMVEVLVVTSPECHLCEEALHTLGELADEFDLNVRSTSIGSVEGQRIFELFRPPMPPFVVVDGRLFSSGRLPRKKLRRYLERTRLGV